MVHPFFNIWNLCPWDGSVRVHFAMAWAMENHFVWANTVLKITLSLQDPGPYLPTPLPYAFPSLHILFWILRTWDWPQVLERSGGGRGNHFPLLGVSPSRWRGGDLTHMWGWNLQQWNIVIEASSTLHEGVGWGEVVVGGGGGRRWWDPMMRDKSVLRIKYQGFIFRTYWGLSYAQFWRIPQLI